VLTCKSLSFTKYYHRLFFTPMENVSKQIEQGTKLKHTDTVDKSAPQIDSSVKISENKHGDLLKEVAQGAELKHADTVDKSNPKIEADAKLKTNNRAALFNEIESKSTK
jgi:hypothetical protein